MSASPLQLMPAALDLGPIEAQDRSKRGEKGRERERESEKKVNRVEFLEIKAPKWGSCHTRLIF